MNGPLGVLLWFAAWLGGMGAGMLFCAWMDSRRNHAREGGENRAQ